MSHSELVRDTLTTIDNVAGGVHTITITAPSGYVSEETGTRSVNRNISVSASLSSIDPYEIFAFSQVPPPSNPPSPPSNPPPPPTQRIPITGVLRDALTGAFIDNARIGFTNPDYPDHILTDSSGNQMRTLPDGSFPPTVSTAPG